MSKRALRAAAGPRQIPAQRTPLGWELEEFDEPPDGAVPLPLAPFLTLSRTLDDNGILRDAPGDLAQVSERLRVMTDAHSATIDVHAGTFDIAFAEEQTLFWRSLSRAVFRPFEVEAPDVLRRLTEEQKVLVKSAVRRVWGSMLDELEWQLRLGAYRMIARERTPLARRYTEISSRVFLHHFTIENWRAGTARCPETGERLFDVHLRPAAPAVARSTANAKSKSACGNWLVRLRRAGPQQGPKAQYEKEAAKRFGVGGGQFADAWDHAAQTTANDATRHAWGLPGARWNREFQIDWSDNRDPI